MFLQWPFSGYAEFWTAVGLVTKTYTVYFDDIFR